MRTNFDLSLIFTVLKAKDFYGALSFNESLPDF